MKNGGKRIGAGRPKGSLSLKARTKEAMREHVRQRVSAELDPLLDAQLANAKGIKYLVVRLKSTGKFIRRVGASAPKTHDPDTEIIEVWEKDPAVQAFTDLMNRAMDKPKEQEQEIKLTGQLTLETRLHAARQRAAQRS